MAVSNVTDHEWHLERTIFIYNLGPVACTKVQNEDRVLKAAFGQFGTVKNTEVLESEGGKRKRHVGAALVEFQNDSEAKNAALELQNQLFMIGGTPRPVRACLAKPEHLPHSTASNQAESPAKIPRVVKKSDPQYAMLRRQRDIAVRNLLEIEIWKQKQHAREVDLGSSHAKTIADEHSKFALIREELERGSVGLCYKKLGGTFDTIM